MAEEVQAAGGVVVRKTGEGALEVAVIHRPRYDDWSLPKGKLDPGEEPQQAALREVEEETGHRCELVRELEAVHYQDRKRRPKHVRWWLMRPFDGHFEPNDEVDQLRWLEPDAALEVLDYPHDRELVRSAIEIASDNRPPD